MNYNLIEMLGIRYKSTEKGKLWLVLYLATNAALFVTRVSDSDLEQRYNVQLLFDTKEAYDRIIWKWHWNFVYAFLCSLKNNPDGKYIIVYCLLLWVLSWIGGSQMKKRQPPMPSILGSLVYDFMKVNHILSK